MENKYPWDVKWTRRNRLVSGFVKGSSVLDIGGGLGELTKFLPPCLYRSIDLKKWTDRTIVADLNKEIPDVEGMPFDTVICQGVLEYMIYPSCFLREIKKYGKYMVLTYREGIATVMPRNYLRQETLRGIIKDSGWKIIKVEKSVVKSELIYICKL